jgi:hypothetical protein
MAKRIPLDRLRQISKQRSIRKPLAADDTDGGAASFEETSPAAEWPIRS